MAKQDPTISDPPSRNSSMNSRIEENTTTSAALKQNILSKYDLSGYNTIGSPEYFSFQNQRYMRVKYQSDHEGEYAIFQMKGKTKHGPAQLFKHNMLKMAWEMENGNRVGELKLYECGRVHKYTRWEYLREDEIRWFGNGENGLYLEIEDANSGRVIYRGEYDPNTLKREGYGIEYDVKTGGVLSAGYYHNNRLVHSQTRFHSHSFIIIKSRKSKPG